MREQAAFEVRGRVEAVLSAHQTDSTVSFPAAKIQVICGHGVRHDRHVGPRLADVRERPLLEFGLPKGVQIANAREFSAVSREDLAEIETGMGLPGPIPFGSLGENLVVSGIPRFTELPTGTLLFFQKEDGTKRTAVLAVWGENMPCTAPGEVIQGHFPTCPGLATLFPKAALRRRGVVGFAYSSGFIHAQDVVVVKVPAQKLYTPDAE